MLTDRPEFRTWLARHDADAFRVQKYGEPAHQPPKDGRCESCGGPVGETPSQVGEECVVCLAERFGGDQVEERLTTLFVGGLVKAAMATDEISDDLVVSTVQDAIREHEHEHGFAWGRGVERGRKAVA